MQYKEIILKIKTSDEDTATAIVSLLDIGGIYTEDYSDLEECPLVKNFALIDEELLKKDKNTVLLHIYFAEHIDVSACLDFIKTRFDAENIAFEVMENKVEEDDFANNWKQYYKPLKIKNITVVPEWEDYKASDGETVLRIDPGVAFGTGNHETTSLCVEKLQETVKKGDKVLDLGCGSGILSIASLLLGASAVDAVDIDPNAVKISKENASLNKFDGIFRAETGNVLEKGSGIFGFVGKGYNVVVANIVADVLIRICSFIKEHTAPGAYFILSGIICERCGEVEKALKDNGFTIEEIAEKRGWNCIVARA